MAMRILEVITAPVVSGAHNLVNALARAWREDGHHVDVVALDAAFPPEQHRLVEEMFGHRIPVLSGTGTLATQRPARRLQRFVRLRHHIASHRYDVIHAHALLPNQYARLAAMTVRAAPPVVITLHSGGDDYSRLKPRMVERCLVGRNGAVVAVSPEAVAQYAGYFPGAADRLHEIPNGLPWPVEPKRVHASDPKRFLAVGRVAPARDVVTLLEGFDRFVQATGSEAELRIAGPFDDPAYRDRILGLHQRLAHRGRIGFLGSRDDIPALLHDSDVFVHTAPREAHPIAVIEAAAAALPAVVSDLPSTRRLLGAGARLFAPGNPDALAEQLGELTAQWPAAVTYARQRAEAIGREFAMRKCSTAYMDLLEGVTQA
jgi:glycosyltransferase involved in cell wall biosynthesis